RDGHPRLPAGVRDPVRRLRLPGLRPDRQPGGQAALPDAWRAEHPDGHPDPLRRRDRRRRAPQRVARELLRAHRRAQGRQLRDAGGRLLDDPAGRRLGRPGRLPRAEAPLPRAGRGGRVGDAAAAARRLGAARGPRRHAAGLRPDGQDLPGRRRGRGRRGSRPRGRRPALVVPAGHGRRRHLGPEDRPGGRGARGADDAGAGRRAGRPGHRGVLLLPGGAGAAGRRLRHPVPAEQGRGRLPARPGPGARHGRPLAGLL
ncbi:MAG: Branched-chain alpha-keto acid dehydrogenase, E1 component, beta subunit, partial [uncultured Friedmanniella sp.]